MVGRVCRVAFLVLACGSCAAPGASRRFDESVAEIEEHWTEARHAVEEVYRAELARLNELEKGLVPVEPGSHSAPAVRVGEREALKEVERTCARIPKEYPQAEECWAVYRKRFIDGLVSTYWAADVEWILAAMKQSGDGALDFEATFVYSHNLRLRAYLAERRAAAHDEDARARQRLRETRDSAIASAMAQRDAENAAFRRRLAVAFLAGVAGAANPRGTSPAYASTGGCSSDYTCGAGYACVKANFSATGTCARTVSPYGVPTYELPRTESVLVKVPDESDCQLLTDCPIGFRCDTSSGACIR